MKESYKIDQKKKKGTNVKTYTVPLVLEEVAEQTTVGNHTKSKQSKEHIINQALKFHSEGKILEAAKYYQHFIDKGLKDHRVFSNYGGILAILNQLHEAEIITCKAIELNPNIAVSYTHLRAHET